MRRTGGELELTECPRQKETGYGSGREPQLALDKEGRGRGGGRGGVVWIPKGHRSGSSLDTPCRGRPPNAVRRPPLISREIAFRLWTRPPERGSPERVVRRYPARRGATVGSPLPLHSGASRKRGCARTLLRLVGRRWGRKQRCRRRETWPLLKQSRSATLRWGWVWPARKAGVCRGRRCWGEGRGTGGRSEGRRAGVFRERSREPASLSRSPPCRPRRQLRAAAAPGGPPPLSHVSVRVRPCPAGSSGRQGGRCRVSPVRPQCRPRRRRRARSPTGQDPLSSGEPRPLPASPGAEPRSPPRAPPAGTLPARARGAAGPGGAGRGERTSRRGPRRAHPRGRGPQPPPWTWT